MGWQKDKIILSAEKLNDFFIVTYNKEVSKDIRQVAISRADKILTLELQDVVSKFNRAVGIEIYLVPGGKGDSILYLATVNISNDTGPGGYTGPVSYRIELNSYLTSHGYAECFERSSVKLKLSIIKFSDAPLNGEMGINNIRILSTKQ